MILNPSREGARGATLSRLQPKNDQQDWIEEAAVERLALEAEHRALAETQREFEISRDRYIELCDFAPIGFATLRRSGLVENVNLAGAALLGWRRHHLVGKPLLALVAKADRRKFSDYLAQTNETTPHRIEARFPRKQGGELVLEFTSLRAGKSLNDQAPIRAAFRDVTEQRRAEEAARAAQMHLMLVSDTTSVMLTRCSRDLRYLFVNRAYAEFFGLLPSQIVGKPIPEILGTADFEAIKPHIQTVLSGEPVEFELEIQHPAAKRRFIRAAYRPERDDRGEVIGWVGAISDISDRKAMEIALRESEARFRHMAENLRSARDELEVRVRERTAALSGLNSVLEKKILAHTEVSTALRESQARLQAIMDNSPSMIFLKDIHGRYLHCSRQFERQFRMPLNKVLGKSDVDIFPQEQAALLRANDEKIIETRAALQFEEVAMSDVGPRVSIITKFPLLNTEGKIYAIGGIVTDVTERRRLEAEILGISERERRRIAQDLHDGLGQQLAGIWFLSDTLRKNLAAESSREVPAATKIVELLDSAVAQSRRLAQGLHPVSADANGLMVALDNLAASVSEMFNVDCIFRCRRAVEIENNVVATNFYRIAQEAITNSIKHGRASAIQVELLSKGQALSLKVSDNGMGFRPPPRHAGMGLRTMKYRADLIGAEFAILKGKTGGTKVVCHIGRHSMKVENGTAPG